MKTIYAGLINYNKNTFTFLFIALCGFLILNSCKSVTEAEDSYKNPNDMTWTCDTVYSSGAAQTLLEHFLAFSSNNIYAYGHNSDGKHIWRYNGSKWAPEDISNSLTGFKAGKLIGFSSSDIWGFGSIGGGYLSKIARYNGSTWQEYTDGAQVDANLMTAAADKKTNIYAAGYNGWIIHYNGGSWSKEQIKMYVPSGGFYALRSSAIWKDTTYFTAHNTNNLGREVFYFIKGTYKNWVIADSMVIDNFWAEFKWGWYGMKVTPDDKLISYGVRGIFEYDGKSWTKIYDSPDNGVYDVFILNNNYKIAVCAFSKVSFYDGKSWTDMGRFASTGDNIEYTDAWGDGKELFIMGFTTGNFPQKTLIWHGK
jgi:hypothetical protein